MTDLERGSLDVLDPDPGLFLTELPLTGAQQCNLLFWLLAQTPLQPEAVLPGDPAIPISRLTFDGTLFAKQRDECFVLAFPAIFTYLLARRIDDTSLAPEWHCTRNNLGLVLKVFQPRSLTNASFEEICAGLIALKMVFRGPANSVEEAFPGAECRVSGELAIRLARLELHDIEWGERDPHFWVGLDRSVHPVDLTPGRFHLTRDGMIGIDARLVVSDGEDQPILFIFQFKMCRTAAHQVAVPPIEKMMRVATALQKVYEGKFVVVLVVGIFGTVDVPDGGVPCLMWSGDSLLTIFPGIEHRLGLSHTSH
jgi:hypothetical protein